MKVIKKIKQAYPFSIPVRGRVRIIFSRRGKKFTIHVLIKKSFKSYNYTVTYISWKLEKYFTNQKSILESIN